MWRDTARPVRIGFLDARAAAGAFVWLLHMSWPTFWLSLFLAAGFVALGHFGITPPAFLRSRRGRSSHAGPAGPGARRL